MAYQYGCLYGMCWSEHFGFSIQVAFLEVWNVTWGYHFLLNYTKILFLSFWASLKLILTFNKWGGVACETTSIHSLQYYFCLQNTCIHSLQLSSTSASPWYLIHCFQLIHCFYYVTFINICFTMIPYSLIPVHSLLPAWMSW